MKCFRILVLLLLGALTLPAFAQGPYPANILAKVPADTLAAVVCPSLKALEEQGNALVKLPGLKDAVAFLPPSMDVLAQDCAKGLELDGVKNFSDLGKILGMDPNKPAAAIFMKDGKQACVLIPIASPEKAEKILASKPAGEVKEVPLGINDLKGKYKETADFGYFIHDGYLYAGKGQEGLKVLAAATANAKTVRCGTADFPVADPSEVILYVDFKVLDLNALPEDLTAAKPALSTLSQAYDEAILAIKSKGNALNLRIAGHTSAGTPYPELAPLQFPALFSTMGAAMLDLRLSTEFKDFIGQQIESGMANPSDGKRIRGIFTGLAKNIGEEIALSITNVSKDAPEFMVCLSSPNPSTLMVLLGLAKFVPQPPATPDGPQMSVAKDLLPGTTFFAVNGKDRVVIGVNEAAVKAAAAGTNSTGASDLPKDILGRANQGFFVVNGEKGLRAVSELAELSLPENAAQMGNLCLSLEQYPTWRQAVLNIPNASPIASMAGKAVNAPRPPRKPPAAPGSPLAPPPPPSK